MARKPRIHAPGTIQHLISRGNRRQDIFESPGEFQEFLGSFIETIKGGDMQPLGLCLMPNHWHALVLVGAVPIGEVLQPILSKFALRSNLRNGRNGHVFGGRFKSYLLDSLEKAKHVLRYIHKNPLRAKIVTDPSDWPWSSHEAYTRENSGNGVSTSLLLSTFSNDPSMARRRYIEFMKEEVPEGVRPDMLPVLNDLAARVERESCLSTGALRSSVDNPTLCRERHRFIRLADRAGVRAVDIAAYLRISRSTVFYAKRG